MPRPRLWIAAALSLLAGSAATAEDAPATGLDAHFPPERLDLAQSAEHLSSEQLGPGAQRYGQTTVTDALGTELERQVEAALLGNRAERLAAPPALRQFSRDLLRIVRVGQPMDIHLWFLAEHAGLVHPPTRLGMFLTGETDPQSIAETVSPLLTEVLKDDSLSALAVSLDPIEGGFAGQVTAMYETIEFEPFDRSYEPGAVATIPGTVLSSKERYQLFITYPGNEVRTYDLGGEGAFDIEVPLPTEPGAYRLAMARMKKRRTPDSPFFFTLYVGESVPSSFSFQVPELAQQTSLEAIEDDFVAKINDERVTHGLTALQIAGSRQGMRDIMDSAPDKDLARYRHLAKALSVDPAPEIPHGPWESTWSQGVSSTDAAWMALQHPVSRSVLLDERAATVRIGSQATEHGYWIAATTMQAAAEAGTVREHATEVISALWDAPPSPAPALQAKLDHLAERVMDGDINMQKAFKEVSKLLKSGTVLGGAITMAGISSTAAQPPDLSTVSLAPGAKYLAIGEASGDFGTGSGVEQTLLLIVTASQAK